MNFAEIQEQGFIPLYKRSKLTDGLHDACGFHTDYQFITKSQLKTIQKKSKGKESITKERNDAKNRCIHYICWDYSDFLFIQLSKIGLYTKSKTAKPEAEREEARQAYLDKVGIHRDFRW